MSTFNWGKSVAFLSLILIFGACSRNPVTGKREVVLMSEKKEIALGKQSDPAVQAQFGVYEDEAMQAFINEKGQQMAKISHRPHLEYHFKVLDSPVVNAFALPGGYIYFTRGIMAHFNNEAEFAGVLGHEIGHVTARHGAKQQTSQILGQVGFIVGMIASEEIRKNAQAAQQAMGLMFLKFSRDDESQSDELGVEYSTKIGYDAHEMAGFFNTLSTLSGGEGQAVPDFLSTHPNPVDRNRKVGEMATAIQEKSNLKNLEVNRDSYLAMIENIIYGEDPRQGYVEGNAFYHPELRFKFNVPSGWQHQNSPSQFQMAPEGGKAMMMLTVGQGQTLADAKNKLVTEMKLNVTDSRSLKINGLNAFEMLSYQAEQPQGGQAVNAATNNQGVANDKPTGTTNNGGGGTKPKGKVQKNGQVLNNGTINSGGTKNGSTTKPTGTIKSGSTTGGSTPTSTGKGKTTTTGNSNNNNGGSTNNTPSTVGEKDVQIKTYLIEYGDLIYVIHGMSYANVYSQYSGSFSNVGHSFGELTDQSKINVTPDRIRIKTVSSTGTLESALKSVGTPADKMKDLAVLNGMKLTDQVKAGSKIKTLGK